ncbi:threonine-phosphate decarboxylase CobD [Planococcus salinus]|uniref:threonine-phosphate decarboxylase n=1 Tax=Planococcus salinus TaxID=1848460 RepID=A0A3M8P8R9_9BACL|nr:threonine-phosphate decarboxylase CobD [Planococcus salinus]RNF40053.1 threonine-phosphate decarboxylase [Planococcus salinus]
MKLPDHGANPHRLYEAAGVEQPSQFFDFSENVHPFGPPQFINRDWQKLLPLISRYPDPEAEPFRSAAANFHHVMAKQVAAGNGAAEIFTWLARRYREKRVVLIEPAFSEYRKTLQAENVEINKVHMTAKSAWNLPMDELVRAIHGSSALYICNPHNPTGSLIQKEELISLAKACEKAGCELVVDEAFIDFAGEQFSVIPYVNDFSNLIVVRSMTKMYAIPGLRLGYVISTEQVVDELKKGAAQWNVNALSAAIGSRCFEESAYREQIQHAAGKERKRMERFLKQNGCEATDSAANFLSFRLPNRLDSDEFFEGMLKEGFVLRHTYSFEGMDGNWFRIGMKSEFQMEALREVMTKWLKEK